MLGAAIVTGANGFIGSHICNKLAESGVTVYAVVNVNTNNIDESSNIKVIRYDDDIQKMVSEIKCDIDCVYHIAWGAVFGSIDAQAQIRNISQTCKMVDFAKAVNAKKFVFAGSAMEYSISSAVFTKSFCPSLRNLYYSAKQTANIMAMTMCQEYRIPYVEGAITNAYGPGSNINGFMNYLLTNMIEDKPIDLTEGMQDYDFIFISDLVEAFILLGEKGDANHVYYVGSNEPKQLREFIMSIKKHISSRSELRFGAIKDSPIGLDFTKLSVKGLYSDLQFKQKVSFEQGIDLTIEWLRSRA